MKSKYLYIISVCFSICLFSFTSNNNEKKEIYVSNYTLSSNTYSLNPIKNYYLKKGDTLDCLIETGQSLIEGGSNASLDATYRGYQNTFIWWKTDSTLINQGTIASYNYSVTSNWRTSALTYVGPDCSIGYSYYSHVGKPLLIMKYAYSGSAMVDDGTTTTAAGIWQVDADYTRASGILHYKKLINNFLIPLLEYCKSRGIHLNVIGILWGQGETDMNSLYRSTHYKVECIRMLDSIRARMVPYNVLSPLYKPIIMRSHNRFDPARLYEDSIRKYQVEVSNHFGGHWINIDRWPLAADSTHLTPQGEIYLGLTVDSIIQLYHR